MHLLGEVRLRLVRLGTADEVTIRTALGGFLHSITLLKYESISALQMILKHIKHDQIKNMH